MVHFKIALILVCTALVLCSHGAHAKVCSGNGRLFSDVGVCECFECFSGSNCEDTVEPCVVTATGGDPGAFTDYWERHAADAYMGTPAAYRNTYQFNTVYYAGQPAPGIGRALVTAIRELHEMVGNVETKEYHIVPGHGCTNLIAAIQYAYAKLAGKTMTVFARPPYYNGYKSWATSGSRHVSFSQDLNLNPDDVIEFVTVPNNPDGLPREATYDTKFLVHDMVYNWPSLTNTTKLAAHDVMLFSLSKMSGHAGSRFGWALVKDKEVAALMGEFIGLAEIHVGIDAQHRALTVIGGILKENGKMFDEMKEKLGQRWDQVLRILTPQVADKYEVQSVAGQFYLWVKCHESNDCAGTFLDAGIRGIPGTEFGADKTYARISVVQNDVMFKIFLSKLSSLVGGSEDNSAVQGLRSRIFI